MDLKRYTQIRWYYICLLALILSSISAYDTKKVGTHWLRLGKRIDGASLKDLEVENMKDSLADESMVQNGFETEESNAFNQQSNEAYSKNIKDQNRYRLDSRMLRLMIAMLKESLNED